MKILLIGYGRMGKLIEQTASAAHDEIAAVIDLDNIHSCSPPWTAWPMWPSTFPRPDALAPVEDYIRRTGTPLLSGVTGYSAEQMDRLRALSAYAPVLHSGNYSVGIAVFRRVLEQVSADSERPISTWRSPRSTTTRRWTRPAAPP